MTVVVTFDAEEIERIIRKEIAEKYNSEVDGIEFDYSDEIIKATLGGSIPQRGGPGDR